MSDSIYCTMLVKVRRSLLAKKCHAKRERTNSEYPFTVVVKTGELIVGHEKLPQFARCFYEKMSRFSIKLRDPLLDNNVLGFFNLSSARNFFWGGGGIFHGKKFLQAGV